MDTPVVPGPPDTPPMSHAGFCQTFSMKQHFRTSFGKASLRELQIHTESDPDTLKKISLVIITVFSPPESCRKAKYHFWLCHWCWPHTTERVLQPLVWKLTQAIHSPSGEATLLSPQSRPAVVVSFPVFLWGADTREGDHPGLSWSAPGDGELGARLRGAGLGRASWRGTGGSSQCSSPGESQTPVF